MKKVIKMSPKRVALVSAIRAVYGQDRDDVTRKELQSVVDVEPRVHSWPTWLVNNDDLRLDRGFYVLPEENGSYDDGSKEIPVSEMITPEASALTTVALATNVNVQDEQDSYIPAKYSGYVPFGNFNTVKDVLKSRMFYPMFITGLSGNGKTLMVQETCARLKREYVRANVTIETDEDDLIGGFRLLNGETVWHDGPVITAMKRGAVLLLDEIDLASNKIMCLQPILEGSSIYIKKIGKWIHPADGFTVIATANTKGQGSDDGRFIGTNVLNEAFLERFPITLEQSYPTTKMEEKILTNEFAKTDKIEPELVTNLVRWADVIRKTFSEGGCDEIISTRRLVHIVNAYNIFENKMQAIQLTVNRFDDETKESFLDLFTKIDAGADIEELTADETEENTEEFDV
jgi:MoxR-like ATPase